MPRRFKPCAFALDDDSQQGNTQEDDLDWLERYNAILHGSSSGSAYSPEQWNRACRSAKLSSVRVLVFVHYLAGERRTGDLKDQFYSLASTVIMLLLVVSVDLTIDPEWGLMHPSLVNMMEQQGFVDGVGGGPPCGTSSALRFLPNGPPPLRRRGACSWGLPKLSQNQAEQVRIANILMLSFIASCEFVAQLGGAFFLEHLKI